MYYINSLDNLTSFYLPNTYYTYGKDGIAAYGLQDTRTARISVRTMITTNDLDPKCWQITKVQEMAPQGLLKLSLKADDFDSLRDNVDLKICDYYTKTGDVEVESEKPTTEPTEKHDGQIIYQVMDDATGFLKDAEAPMQLNTAKTYYFKATDTGGKAFSSTWRVSFNGFADNDAMDSYVHLTMVNKNTVSVKISRTKKVDNQTLILSVSDTNGDYKAEIKLGVIYK